MTEGISSITAEVVKLALDASVMQHKVIANNIANANTDGFKPQTLAFEPYLRQLSEHIAGDGAEQSIDEHISSLRNQLNNGEGLLQTGEQKVQLDMEMAKLADNTLHYKALLEGLSKYGSLLKMAIKEDVRS
ncbi:MAG: flagellar basal body rod protein FlgB [Gammaproteobacteria bacterium]|nr:flagellar basal body rod protein FlgB [Gammaproteobacteria bacterium]MDH5730103.1 flagellar basal body rod protein FlgB [Gammaproteobacteria bacterium]